MPTPPAPFVLRLLHRVSRVLYPRAARRRFAAELERALADTWRDERAAGRRATRLALRLAWDALLSPVLWRIDAARRRRASRHAGRAVAGPHSWRPTMDTLGQDLRYAVRALGRAPAFSALAIALLAVGLAAPVAVFTLVDAVLLRPLPYPQADRLVMIWDVPRDDPATRNVVFPPNVADWREQTTSFDGIATFNLAWLTLPVGDDLARISGAAVSANYFDVVGVRPLAGRAFRPDEEGPGRPLVAIVSYGFWQRELGGAPDVVGTSLPIGPGLEVIGVMPQGFEGPEATFFGSSDFWLPIDYDVRDAGQARPSRRRGAGAAAAPAGPSPWPWVRVVARLAPGVDLAAARREIGLVGDRLAETYPQSNADWTATVVSLHDQVTGRARATLLAVLGVVCLVLLVACANMANLMASRGLGRAREFAVRAALGASRARLVQTVLAESAVLAAAAGALGVVLAGWVVRALDGAASGLPRTDGVALNGAAVALAFVLAGFTTVLVGIWPGLSAGRRHLPASLMSARASSGPAGRRLRAGLVAAQLAVSLVLLAAAGLMARTFVALITIDPGFAPDRIVLARVDLPRNRAGTLDEIARALAGLPGVEVSGAVSTPPLGRTNDAEFLVEIDGGPGATAFTAYRSATPGYFESIGVPVVAGRGLLASDHASAPGAVVVNDAFVERYLPGLDPLGHRVGFSFQGRRFDGAIVGVVRAARLRGLTTAPVPEIYVPHAQHPALNTMFLTVRTAADPAGLVAPVRQALRDVAPRLIVGDVEPMTAIVARATGRPRFLMQVFAAFAAVGVLLAATGLYAVMAQNVAQRTREIGIRLALGAEPSAVRALVLGDGLRVTAAGIGLGLLAAVASTRVLAGMLYQVTATDPVTLAAVSLALVAVAALAAYVPARRASRVDPIGSIRVE